jgi:hypothetical protein
VNWQAARHATPDSYPGLPAPHLLAHATEVAWWPQYQGFDLRQSWRIEWERRSYDVVALTYLQQRIDKKLIYYANRIAPAERVLARDDLQPIDGTPLRRVAVRTATGSRVVWWFYLIGERATTSKYEGKWLQFAAALRGDTRASLVAISTRCRQPDCAQEMQQTAARPLLGEIIATWNQAGTFKANQISAR